MAYPRAEADRLRKILGSRRGLTEKDMFGGIAFLLDGNLCTGLLDDDLIVRVPPAETAGLLKEPGAKPFSIGGRAAMAGWLLVEPTGYRTEAALRAWVDRGIAYASSLPKKAGKARKKR